MRRAPALLAAVLSCLAHAAMAAPAPMSLPPAPEAAREGEIETLHGVDVADPYRWLEDRDSPRTRAFVEAQEARTRAALDAVPGRAALRRRVSELVRVDQLGTPEVRNGRYFYARRLADQDQFILYVRDGLRGSERVLVDPHPLSPDHSVSASLLDIDAAGRLVLYGLRRGGADELELHLRDVESGKDLPDAFPSARYMGLALTPDGRDLYYGKALPEGPRLYRHRLGAAEPDALIFGEGLGPEKGIGAQVSDDGRWLVMSVWYGSAGDKTDVYARDLRSAGPTTTIADDIPARFEPGIGGDRLYMLTDWKAPHGRILAVDLEHPSQETWKEIVPEGDTIVTGYSLVGGRIAVEGLHDVRTSVRVFTPEGKMEREIEMPSLGAMGGLGGRWSSNEAFFSFSSLNVPQVVERYEIAEGRRTEWARPRLPFSGSRYEVEQVWVASSDGAKVPMFVAHARGAQRDGSHPTLMTAYGGFNLSELPWFSVKLAAWLDAGGVVALPNLRGGGEFGEDWHRAGMLGHKQQVFDDFLAAAQWLVDQGWTRPGRLAITGRSNGGLLTGAALTQRPDMFGAVVIGYPLLDMLRYQRFLVAKYWVPEYGSSEDPEQFAWLRAYSPYHRVVQGTRYPAVMLVSGDSDTRVDPLHARKMAALLQWAQGGDAPILLHYDAKAGHSGGEPADKQVDEITDELAFLGWRTGLFEGGPSRPSARRRASLGR